MMSAAAPKQTGSSAGQTFVKWIIAFCASVCLTLFLASPGLAQRGSHGGGSHGGGSHGGASHGGGFSGGSHGSGFGGSGRSGGQASSGAHVGGSIPVAPARSSMGMARGGGSSGVATAGGALPTGYAGSVNSGTSGMGFAMGTASAPPTAGMGSAGASGVLHTIFVDASGRVLASPGNPPVGSRLWGGLQQQQQQHPVTPPPAPRPAPMPVAPMVRPPVAQTPIAPMPMMRPPVLTPPVMSRPMVRIPPTSGAPMPVAPRPIMKGSSVGPGPAIRAVLPGPPRARVGNGLGAAVGAPLPVPPQMRKMQLEPGISGTAQTFSSGTGYTATPIPPLFCGQTLGDCGVGFHRRFDNDFDDFEFEFGFNQPFFFAFGGPFGFGEPCFFNGFFLNCIGTGWNGPFGWGWGTPWGYNPGTGSLYPIGGYYEPTPAEMNQASVDYLGPTAFLPPQPTPLALAPEEAPAQPLAILVLKDGTEFGVTSYWLQDNRLYYVTTYNIQSSIPIEQLDLQATVDLNYKRGVTFTLTPKPEEQQQPPEQQ